LSIVAYGPYISFSALMKNFGLLVRYPAGSVSAWSQSRSVW